MKVIIAGSRSIKDYCHVKKAIKASGYNITAIACGLAQGVDLLGKEYGKRKGIKVKEFPAKWNKLNAKGALIRYGVHGPYNAKAGFNRNLKMAKWAKALIVVWDGRSKGSLDMIEQMKALRKKVFIYMVKK